MTTVVPLETRLDSPNIRVYFTEVLAECSKRKTRAERIALLQKFQAKNAETKLTVQKVMEWLTNDKVAINLPKGDAPYKDRAEIDYNTAPLTLIKALDRAKYFVKGCPSYLESTVKREHFFVQTLEALYKPDAQLLVALKDKTVPDIHGVTVQLLVDAYGPKEDLGNAQSAGA